jgi:hypothetical protein
MRKCAWARSEAPDTKVARPFTTVNDNDSTATRQK